MSVLYTRARDATLQPAHRSIEHGAAESLQPAMRTFYLGFCLQMSIRLMATVSSIIHPIDGPQQVTRSTAAGAQGLERCRCMMAQCDKSAWCSYMTVSCTDKKVINHEGFCLCMDWERGADCSTFEVTPKVLARDPMARNPGKNALEHFRKLCVLPR